MQVVSESGLNYYYLERERERHPSGKVPLLPDVLYKFEGPTGCQLACVEYYPVLVTKEEMREEDII